MKLEDVAKLWPGIYKITYENGNSDLAAVGEVISHEGGVRWYAPISTVIATRNGNPAWSCWDDVVSAELVLDRADLVGTTEVLRENATPTAAWWTHEVSCRCETCKVHA